MIIISIISVVAITISMIILVVSISIRSVTSIITSSIGDWPYDAIPSSGRLLLP